MKPLQKKKPKRAYSAAAVLGGVALLIFELTRDGNPEAWFWIPVAVLMIVLGLFGVFQRDEDEGEQH